MPYNPQATDIRGQIFAQAGQQLGGELGAGIRQYAQNKQMAAQAVGNFEGALKANPQMLQFLESDNAPDAVKSAYNSLKTGGAVNFQKAAILSQFADTYGRTQTQGLSNQAATLANTAATQANSQAAYENARRQKYDSWIDAMSSGAAAGTGGAAAAAGPSPAPAAPVAPSAPDGSAPAPVPQAPAPIQPSAPPPGSIMGPNIPAQPGSAIPIQNFVRSYVQAMHMPPPPAVLEKFMATQMDQEQPIGVIPGASSTDANGTVNSQTYNWVYRKGSGGTRVAPEPVTVPTGGKPPGQILDPQTFQPVTASTLAKAPDQSKPVIMTPERQKAINDTATHLNLLQNNEDKLAKMDMAVAAYNKANPNGLRTNMVMGTPHGLMLRQALFGDVTGPLVNQGVASNLNAIMENMRGDNKSLGMRLTGTEWDQLKEAFPKTTDAPSVMVSGMESVKRANAFAKTYAQEYLKNLKTKAPGDASEAANESTRKIYPSLSSGPPLVKNQEDYDVLPSGTSFRTPSGTIRTKP